jgi:chromate transport protein ChrA
VAQGVVSGFGWLSQQLLDAMAVGQMTPGPVLSSATFIGYLVAGVPGAVVSTVAVFLPSFITMSITAEMAGARDEPCPGRNDLPDHFLNVYQRVLWTPDLW